MARSRQSPDEINLSLLEAVQTEDTERAVSLIIDQNAYGLGVVNGESSFTAALAKRNMEICAEITSSILSLPDKAMVMTDLFKILEAIDRDDIPVLFNQEVDNRALPDVDGKVPLLDVVKKVLPAFGQQLTNTIAEIEKSKTPTLAL